MSQKLGAMNLVDPDETPPMRGVRVPEDFYWVLNSPTPLAGMRYPGATFPWPTLNAAGFSEIVSLHPGAYNHKPLNMAFATKLEDLVGGGPPAN
jgi:hypothetical protein